MKWWSASKHAYQELKDMHTANLVNARKKMQRGEYAVPADDDDPLVTRPANEDEKRALEDEFQREFSRRGLDSDGYEVVPQDEGFA